MDTLSIRFVFDRKGETKNDAKKNAPVQIKVFVKISRKKVYISTGIKILKSQYSANGGFSIKNHPNSAVLKGKAHKIYNEIEAFIHSDLCKSIDDVKSWNKDESLTVSVAGFIRAELNKR